MKNLVCTPVVLQRKYPLLLLPCLDCLLEYYYSFLIEEYSAFAIQPEELSTISAAPTDTTTTTTTMNISQKGLNPSQRESIYTAQWNRDILPLNYLSMSSIRFISNVLSSSAYDISNIYKPNNTSSCTSTATQNKQEQECLMEESAEIKTDTVTANEIRTIFFNKERITNLLYILLHPLLTYCNKELLIWNENPEDFIRLKEQSNTNEIISIKTISESLFYGLIEINPSLVCSIVGPFLMDCTRQEKVLLPISAYSTSTTTTGTTSTSATTAINCPIQQYFINRELKLYDSVYVAAGLGVAHLAPYLSNVKKQFDFSGDTECTSSSMNHNNSISNNTSSSGTSSSNSTVQYQDEDASYWVQNYLGPMVQQLLTHPTVGCLLPDKLQLLRARLVWLLSKWMDQFDGSVLPHVLSILIDIIGPAGKNPED